jgi:gluconate 2-dehydrogenase subunit 3-like protein
MNSQQVATLAALANGIIPPDQTDDGAAGVNAGERLAQRIQSGVNAALYLQGLATATSVARQTYGREVNELNPAEIHQLIAGVRDKLPAFFKQLRMDVSALYLSDPAVWERIGFPGPATASGGYPDFDQPQTQKITRLKEIQS